MSRKRILVINPNSNRGVTAKIQAAAEEVRPTGVAIDCRTLTKGPYGIETDEDIASVVPLVMNEIAASPGFDAYVIACYSDPGLAECRNITDKTVLGIQESAVGLSASYGRNFGVIALSRDSVQRHIAYVRQLGFQGFHAGERSLEISVDEAASSPDTLGKVIVTGRQLIEEDGAETLILGCAGMAAHRQPAQEELGVPVIEPTQAAVEQAVAAVTG